MRLCTRRQYLPVAAAIMEEDFCPIEGRASLQGSAQVVVGPLSSCIGEALCGLDSDDGARVHLLRYPHARAREPICPDGPDRCSRLPVVRHDGVLLGQPQATVLCDRCTTASADSKFWTQQGDPADR